MQPGWPSLPGIYPPGKRSPCPEPTSRSGEKTNTTISLAHLALETDKGKQFCQETARAEIKNGNYAECKALILGLIAACVTPLKDLDFHGSPTGGRTGAGRRVRKGDFYVTIIKA